MNARTRKGIAGDVSGDIIEVVPIVSSNDGDAVSAEVAHAGIAGSTDAAGNGRAVAAGVSAEVSSLGEGAARGALQPSFPTVAEFESELKRVKARRRFRRVLGGVLGVLLVVAAAAILLATRFFPVLQIYGNSMTPTLNEGEIVVAFDLG